MRFYHVRWFAVWAALVSTPLMLVPAGSAAQSPADPGQGPAAHQLFVAKCTGCHVATQVTSQHRSADQWAETMEQMIARGAEISDSEFDVLLAYLARNHGPTTAGK